MVEKDGQGVERKRALSCSGSWGTDAEGTGWMNNWVEGGDNPENRESMKQRWF